MLLFLVASSPLFEMYWLFQAWVWGLGFVTWYRFTVRPGELNLVPGEVKYRERLRSEDLESARVFAEKYGGGGILSKNEFRAKDEFVVIPVHTFLILV